MFVNAKVSADHLFEIFERRLLVHSVVLNTVKIHQVKVTALPQLFSKVPFARQLDRDVQMPLSFLLLTPLLPRVLSLTVFYVVSQASPRAASYFEHSADGL